MTSFKLIFEAAVDMTHSIIDQLETRIRPMDDVTESTSVFDLFPII